MPKTTCRCSCILPTQVPSGGRVPFDMIVAIYLGLGWVSAIDVSRMFRRVPGRFAHEASDPAGYPICGGARRVGDPHEVSLCARQSVQHNTTPTVQIPGNHFELGQKFDKRRNEVGQLVSTMVICTCGTVLTVGVCWGGAGGFTLAPTATCCPSEGKASPSR